MRTPLLALLLAGAAPPPPLATAESPAAAIHLDQLGFTTAGPKLAVLPEPDDTPRDWQLIDAAGRVRLRGRTRPFGIDPGSGERVHIIDLSAFSVPGEDYRLRVGAAASHPFRIGPAPFAGLARAAMGFFYQQRSGVPIRADLAGRADLARAAGHPDERVTCFSGRDQLGVRWPGCDDRRDVTGGWYDAGDHGKYVVNGGISAWTLLDLHQRLAAWGAPDLFADGRLAVPERGNGIDDLLDEARVEVEFLLAMQIPAGTRMAVALDAGGAGPVRRFATIDAGGLAYAKVADEAWTPLPTAPANDRMRRFLYPPTTAATLNMVAVAAQAARVWATIDPAFAARARAAAILGWDAAARHPALLASSHFTGNGGYGDAMLDDERFWAAAELLATTGERRFADHVAASPFLDHSGEGLDWARVDLAGILTLTGPAATIPAAIRSRAQTALLHRADALLAARSASGYRLPYAGRDFRWGSNATWLNDAILLGASWQVSGQVSPPASTPTPARAEYRDAVVDVIDYVLGRNALDRSYVTGFGVRPMRHPHHRFWAIGIDPRYPAPPPGVLSGGPNSTAMSDPVAAPMKGRCTGQTCWVDAAGAYTMNEVAINWNAPLVWVAAFLTATEPR